MFDFFSQKRLQNRGLSSGRKRRKTKDSKLKEWLRSGMPVCGALFLVFAIGLSIWLILSSNKNEFFNGKELQTFIGVAVITVTFMIHWHVSLPDSFRRNSRVLLMLLVIIGQLILVQFSRGVSEILAKDIGAANFEFLVAPYAFAAMIMSLLIGRRHATFAVVYSSLLGGLMVEQGNAFKFLVYSLICGFAAIYLANSVRKRSRLVMAGIFVGFVSILLGLTLGEIYIPWSSFISTPPTEAIATVSESANSSWELFGRQALTAMVVSTLTAILVGGILPFAEMAFRITTDVSWMELSDLNHPLLKKMTIEAPGTYHHSLVVANLSEAAAEAVGANAAMCRVCSYFHDIGKMAKPEYFVENISEGQNPHDDLTPTMSALIVIAHVKDGVDYAIKHKLNREIIDVIREHHGTSLVRFFYHRALQQKKDFKLKVEEGNAREEDTPEVKKESFRYPGPRPRTRESAIISLADAVESASRSMQKPTPKKIDELIDELVKDRLHDGQLDNAALTLKDLATIKHSFAVTLRSMMHTRIAYPKIGKDAKGQEVATEPSPSPKKQKGAETQVLRSIKSKDSNGGNNSVEGAA
ncbi:MAG: HD family phosphohydrolase [Verrucomicrobiales bacterium]